MQGVGSAWHLRVASVLHHENHVLRRQLSGRLRWSRADRLWLAVLSGWCAAAAGRRSSQSPRPRSCAGTVTSLPQVGLHQRAPTRTTVRRYFGQDAGRPDGAVGVINEYH